MLSAFDVAAYFLSSVDEEHDEGLSNLKLQKLVYYAQGFNLALFGEPLFSEDIEAWTHGPVVPELYQAYKRYGSDSIPAPDSIDLSKFGTRTTELLDEIYQVFGQFSAWGLRNLTHNEPPWRDTLRGDVISHAAMQKYFVTRLA